MSHPPAVLEFHDASLRREGRTVLHSLNLRIAQGEHTAIFGPNGSGKSSLLRLISREHYPAARDAADTASHRPAAVTILGRERWNVFELRSLLGIVSADLHQAFAGSGTNSDGGGNNARRTGFDAVLSGFFATQTLLPGYHEVTAEMRERAQAALALVEAMHLAEKPLTRMSTGEARRILIARALAPDPCALLLDEPTAGLDLLARRRFLETLRHIAQKGKTVILVTHQTEEIIPEIGRVVLLQNGRVFCDGPKAEVLTTPRLSELFGEPVEVRRNGDFLLADVLPA